MNRLDFPVRHPWLVLLLIGAITLAAATHLGELVIDNSTENILPASNKRVRENQLLRETFGSAELIVVGFEVPEGARVVDPRWFAALAELTHELEGIEALGPDKVISLANIQVPSLVSKGLLPGVALVPLAPAPVDRASADRMAQRIGQLQLLQGLIVSKDLRATAVIAKLDRATDPRQAQSLQIRVVKQVQQIIDRQQAKHGLRFHLAGTPVTKSAFVNLLERDMRVFVPTCVLLIGLVLLGLFRSWRGLVLPLATVLLALLWTLATMAVFGRTINTMTALLPPLLMAVGIADAVHLLSHWARCRKQIADPAEAVIEALHGTRSAIVMTTLTTMMGFLSLYLSPVEPIREFGVLAAVGAFYALVLSLTMAPALLRLFPGRPADPDRPRVGPPAGATLLARGARHVGRFAVSHPVWVLSLNALLVIALVGASVAWLRVEVNFVRYFKTDHPLSHAISFFDRRMAGTAPIELVISSTQPGTFKRPETLRKLARFQQDLARFESIDTSISIADFLSAANGLMTGRYEIPATEREIQGFQFYLPLARRGKGKDPVVTEQADTARIAVRAKSIGSTECKRLVTRIHALFERTIQAEQPELTLTVTGEAVIFMEVSDSITVSQVRSFCLALVLVFCAILILLRSLRLALISLVPNLFPIAVAFGIMAATDIDLNTSTAMVACIAIGIAVDDTIHFLSAYRKNLSLFSDPKEAILETCESVGAACAATTVILCAGFGVSALASFYPTIYFGVMSAVTIAAALYADFLLLPALLMVCGSKTD